MTQTQTTLTGRPILVVDGVHKTFTMHLRGGLQLPVVRNVSFDVHAGECTVLGGPSGAGKSSVLKMIYGNYGADGGSIRVLHEGTPVELVGADPRQVLAVRRRTTGYVSQFLRTLPRIAAVDVVATALLEQGAGRDEALERAKAMLARLNLPERLWHLPPATFSGGEQQRVNIARGLLSDHPLLLLDEPTASLDAANRAVVAELIADKKRQGVAMLGIFHDEEMRQAVADRVIDVTAFAPEREAA